MEKQSRKGLRRLWDAVGFSILGLKAAWNHEAAFRQELVMTLVLLPAAWWLGVTMMQRGVLIFSLLFVLIVELLNSAVETVVDRIGAERHPLSGRAKDMGSAAVMLALIAAATVWGLVAWQRWQS
jgi:diacylglycerol kinase (ATP)